MKRDYIFLIGNRHYVSAFLRYSPTGGNDYQLQNDYDASEMNSSSPFEWKFDNGKSAGVCNVNIEGNPYYEADTSDLHQPFDDGFVKFNVSADGVSGSNVVPYLPKEFFDGAKSPKWRLHQI